LATIRNIITTIFNSLNADSTVRDANNVNRSITRLGQSSASAGRAFSAQASGLGGLVAAYAGAAATTFALQQAFDALARSARAAQTLEGLGSLAAVSGQSGKAILSSIQEITKGQITLTEAAQQANLSLSAGFNTQQIEGLAEVATKASRALGRDLNDAYIRVVRGSAKLETELLDELGIYTKIEPATRAYAAAIGKARTELTEYERRQAFANAVIEEGRRKFSAINTTIPTSAEQLEAFGSTVLNIATQIGSFVADRLAPLAAYLTNNVALAFAAVGIAASLVAGKAVTLLTAAFTSFNERVVKAGATTEKIIRAFTLTAAAANKANDSIKALTASQIKLTGTQATQLKGLIDASQSRKLNTLELKESRKLIGQNITALRAERDAFRANAQTAIDAQRAAVNARRAALAEQARARALPQGGGFGTPEFIARTTAINQANAALRRADRALASNAAAYAAASAQVQANSVAIGRNITALNALGPALTGVGARIAAVTAGFVALTTSAITGFGALFRGIVGIGSSILFLGSLFTLLGGAIANALGKGEEFNAFISDLGATVKQFFSNQQEAKAKKVFKGVTVGALAELEKTDAALRNTDKFTFKKKFLFFEVEVEKTKEDLVNEVNSIISDVATGSQRTFADSLVGRGGFIGGTIASFLPFLIGLVPGIGPAAAILGGTFARGFTVAAGAAIGAWIDSTLFADEFDQNSPVAQRIRAQFSRVLSGYDADVQNILVQGLTKLDERYAEAARLDPRARIVLRTQQELLLASGKYFKNIEAVSQLMEATGQTADLVVKQFDFAPVVSQIDYIQTAIASLQGKTLEFTFIDVNTLTNQLRESLVEAALSAEAKLLETLTNIRQGFGEDFYEPEQFKALQNATNLEILKTIEAAQVESARDSSKTILQVLQDSEDTLSKALGKLFSSVTIPILDIQKALAVLPTLEERILPAINASNTLNQALARVVFTQKNLNEGLKTGSLTLEQYEIGFAAIVSAQTIARQEYFATEKLINSLTVEERDLLLDNGINLQDILQTAKDTVLAQQQITEQLKKQEQTLKNQLTISEFLRSFTKDKKNPLAFELEFITERAENDLQSFVNQVDYLSGFITQISANLGATFDKELETYRKNAAALREIGLEAELVTRILTEGTNLSMIEGPAGREAMVANTELANLQAAAEKLGSTIAVTGSGLGVVRDNIDSAATASINLQSQATITQLALYEQALEAIQGLTQEAVNNLPKFIGAAEQEYKAIIKKIDADLKELVSKEQVLAIQFEIDQRNLRQQISEIQSDARIARFESEIEIIEARADLKQLSPVNAANQVAAIERKIIQERQAALQTAFEAELNNIDDRKTILKLESEARKQAIRDEAQAQIDKITQDVAYVSTIVQAYDTFIKDSDKVNMKLIDDFVNAGNAVAQNFATTFQNGATVFATAIRQALTGTFSGQAGAVTTAPASITTTAISTTLRDITTDFIILAGETTSKIIEGEKARIQAETTATERSLELIRLEQDVATARYVAEYAALLRAAELGDLVAQQRLNDIADAANEEAKERREALAQFLQDFSKTLSQVFDFVNQLVTGIFEGKIIQARQNEEFITSVLASTSERLSAAQSELNSSLELEVSLREKLIDATNTLLESQNSYLVALGRQNEEIAASGKEYVDNLLAQKRIILELADANRNSLALGKQVTSLEEMQTSLQQALADATESRIKLENKLAATQEILGAVAQAVTGQINMLADSLRNLGNAAGGGGPAGAKPTEVSVTNLGSVFTPLANTLKTAVTEAAAAASGKAAVAEAAGQTEEATELLAASALLNTASTVISSAMSGYNLGKAIGVALGTDGVASGIGGAIGGIVGTVFKTQIAGFLASTTIGSAISTGVTTALGGGAFGSAAASALGSVFTAAIPVFGVVIGALLGNLFATKPRGQATGVLTAEGFETTSMSGKKIDPKALASIPEQALMGVVTSLKQAGISFADTVKTGIDFYKKGISNATLEFADGLKETFSGGTVQEAGQFFVDAFFKGVRVERDEAGLVTFRSLVVDALTPNRETIQNAADRFAELSDVAEKTVKRFEEAIQFATEFNDTLSKLQGPATSITQAFNLINAAAQQNSIVLAQYYREFLAGTEKTFGASSTEYEAALAAVQANALAQLGLARVTRNGVTEIKSLTEAQSELNAGFLLVTDIIAKATASIDMLTVAGFDNIGTIIETSINTQLTDAIQTTAESLAQTLEVLKNPAKAAVFELEGILDNSVQRISDLRGIVDGINDAIQKGLEIDPALLTQARSNITAAAELVDIELDAYIRSLSEAQLEAVISTDQFSDSINNLAQTQLEYLRVVGSQKAVASLINTGRRLSKTIADITGQFNLFRVNGLLGIGVDIDTLAKNLGQTEITSFTIELNDALNEIATGENIASNLSSSVALLNSEFDAGTLTAEQYAYGIEQVITTTEQYLETLTELSKEYQSTISQISGAFNQSKDTVISTIQELGSQIISLTNNISSKTSEILGIYDDTLASVAESGNELFDLRDTAKDAFETASRAIKEFERSNKLSGKSVETLRRELSSVEAEIASLISADNLDFSGFLQLSELTSKQGALKREISSVVAIESEYEDLLGTRTKALEDLSFVEATLATLDDSLVDTRRKESEIIKKTQDATTSFISAQNDLRDITALLAESNFNLNQIRFDEESAVTRVKDALASYNKDLDNLTSTLEAIGGESGAALQSAFIKAAAGNAEIIFANLEEAARNAKIGEATAQAVEAFDQLQALALQVSGFFEPVDEAFTGLETVSVSLTDKFQQFSTDIVKYLETEGLAQFYGPGGVFFQFKETLLDTIKNQGFDVLTAPGGPLQNFNTNLMNISQAIETLSNAGNFLDITIQTAETTFGSFVTAVGTDLEKLTAGYVGLSIVGANLSDTAPDTISLYAEGIGNLNAVLDEGGSLSILLDAAEAMDSLYSSVTIVDALLNEINFEVSAQNAKDNIVTAVEIVNSTIGTIDLGVSASTMVDNITTNVDLINSTISAVDISVSATAMNEAITSAVGTIDSTLTGVDLTTSTSAMVSAIDTTVTTLDTALSGVDLTDSTSAMVAAIDASVETLNSTLTGVDLTLGTDSAVAAITTSADTVIETLSGVDLTLGTESAIAAITTSADTVIETLSGVDLTSGTDSAVAAITTSAETVIATLLGVNLTTATSSMIDTITTNVTLLNSTIGEVDLTTSTAVMVEAINTTVTTLNSTLEGLSLGTATDSAVGKLSETITAINSTLSNIAFSDAEDVAVGAITNTIEAINSVLERIDLTDVTNSAVGKIEVSILALQSVLDGIDLVEISESTVNKFNAVVEAIVSTLNTIDLVEVTNSTVSKLKATITAMESTLANIDLVEVTESTVEKFEIAVVAIKSTLEDISLVSVTDSAIGEFNALAIAIESTLSSIDLTSVTDSTVGKLTTVVSTIDSTLADIDFVEVTNSTVDKINTLAETTNSTLFDVSFVTATESVVGEINSVNDLVNSNLSDVSFVSSLQSAVDEINLVNSSVNSTLERVDFVTTLSSAVDEISLVNTNINSTLSEVSYSTSLDSAINEITLVNTNINSALSEVTYSTNLDSVIGEISAVNEDINSSLSDVIFVSSLSSAVREINAVTGTLNSTLDDVDFVVSTDSVVEKINAYNTAVNSALSNVALVTATESAVGEINAVNTSVNSTLENVDFAVALNSVVDDITAISVDLNSALDNVNFVITTNAVVEKVTAYNVAVNSALSNITLVDSTSSVVDKIEAVQTAINSSLEGVTLVSATDSAVGTILAAIEAIDSTLTDVTLVDASASTVEAIKAAISAIDSTLNDATLVTSTETVTGAITAVISAINSTLNDVTLVEATASTVEEINAAIIAIQSVLNGVNLVTATNSATGAITTSINSINTTLNGIDLTSGTNSAIKEITDYNSEVNTALGNVSLSAETSNVISEIASITGINVELGKISLSVNLASAKSNISAVNTDLNAVLKGISISTDLETAKSAIAKVNTDLNARLAAIAVETNLSQARTRIDTVNTDLNARLAAINLATNLNQATTRIDGVSTSINTSLGNVNLSNATAVFDALVAVFTQSATDKVTGFKNAIGAFANITTEITNTQELATEIANLAGTTGSVKNLTDRFSSLQTTINSLTGTTGISALQTQINKIATDLQNAWTGLSAKNISVTATVPSGTTMNLGTNDTTYLKGLYDYRNQFPALAPGGVSLRYNKTAYAEGGLVDGPGTSTSDSIPASLSKGEYVLKASSVRALGHEFLNILNQSGDLDFAISSLGRRGDARAAHITPEEMMLLKRLGGSGTRNPRTGLREFYNKDGGALGRFFAEQEADLLWNTYGPKIAQDAYAVRSYSVKNNFGHPEMYEFTAKPSNPFSLVKKESVDVNPVSLSQNALFDAAEISGLQNSQAAVMLALNEMFVARKATPVQGLRSKYGQDKRYSQWDRTPTRYSDRNFIDANFGSGYAGVEGNWADNQNKMNLGYWPDIGYHPGYRAFGGGGNKHGDISAENSGYPARFAQAMTNSVDRLLGDTSSYIKGTLMSKDIVKQAINKLNSSNAYKDFVDFYMLSGTRGTAPTYTSGGLVRGQRDSEISALEPGEFVLRKAAVNQMGLDAAYKLNATGDTGGETNVEVNITNNGAPVNVSATPQIRRENGKLVLDIILEDIRNNGPIRQQIRSIR